MKSLISVIISLFLASSIYAQSVENIAYQIDQFISKSLPESTIISVDVYNLTTKEVLYKKNEKLLLRPASNLKLFTSAAGLYFLGPEYKFTTSFYYTGEIIDSVCTGDIYVVGGFDPEFSSSDLDSVIHNIKEFGIKKIAGNLYGDISAMDSLHWGKGWMWDDDPFLFSPYLSPLSINKNGIEIAYEPADIGFPVKINVFPESSFYSLHNSSVTTINDTSDLNITRDFISNTNDIIVNGGLSFKAKPDTTELNLLNPEQYFLCLMKESFARQDLQFKGFTATATLPVDTILIVKRSHSLTEVVQNLNKESDNLNAEMVLRAVALNQSGKPASAGNGVKMIDSLFSMMKMGNTQYRIVDGSGLSFYNLLTAESINELLKFVYFDNKNVFGIFYNSLPIAGVDGTLKKRMTTELTKNNVRAKTGTLSGISCLSGYLNTLDGDFISFSIMVQNYVGSPKRARHIQDELCKILCGVKNEKL